jgi:hypothetical protein
MDVVIHYVAGDPVALVHPRTRKARYWIADHKRPTWVNSSALIDAPAALLDLIAEMIEAGFVLHWQQR